MVKELEGSLEIDETWCMCKGGGISIEGLCGPLCYSKWLVSGIRCRDSRLLLSCAGLFVLCLSS